MSNKSFQVKKECYGNTRFQLTRELAQNDSWKIKDIIKRGEDLANMALKVWPLPEKYQRANKPPVNLDDNAFTFATARDRLEEFTNKQPFQVILDDHHTEDIESWASLLRLIVQFLAEADVDIIEDISEKYPKLLVSREEDKVKYANYISLPGTHVLLKTYGSAVTILDSLYKIISVFDEKSGKDYLNTIVFKLKKTKEQ